MAPLWHAVGTDTSQQPCVSKTVIKCLFKKRLQILLLTPSYLLLFAFYLRRPEASRRIRVTIVTVLLVWAPVPATYTSWNGLQGKFRTSLKGSVEQIVVSMSSLLKAFVKQLRKGICPDMWLLTLLVLCVDWCTSKGMLGIGPKHTTNPQ